MPETPIKKGQVV